MDQGLNRAQGTQHLQDQAETRSMLGECPVPRIQPLTWIEFSRRGRSAGEGAYGILRGLLRGQVRSVAL